VEFAGSEDRTVVVAVQPSGGRPDFARIALTSPYRSVLGPSIDVPVGRDPDVATLFRVAIYYRGFASFALGATVPRLVLRSADQTVAVGIPLWIFSTPWSPCLLAATT
jgi:hypothetical protein